MIKFQYIISYQFNGIGYAGWQKQEGLSTIQGVLEDNLSIALKEEVTIQSCGRTDKGVSGIMHYSSFLSSNNNLDIKIIKYLNFLLKKYNIAICEIKSIDLKFSVRFDCIRRIYLYRIFNAAFPSPLFKDLSLHIYHPININKMIEASKIFIGTHDFNAFRSSDCSSRTSIRTIYDIKISYNNTLTYDQNHFIDILIEGNAFLHNMIRILISSLVLVSQDKMSLDELKTIFKSKVRSSKITTISSKGLFFLNARFK